jgi:hypothetical protein
MQRIDIPKPVREARGMGEEVAQCDRLLRRPQLWRAGSIEAGKDLRRGERRVNGQRLRVELNLALLDELHRRDRGHHLNHRRDAKDGVMAHRRRLPEMTGTECALVNDAVVGRGHRDDTRHPMSCGRVPQRRIDLG